MYNNEKRKSLQDKTQNKKENRIFAHKSYNFIKLRNEAGNKNSFVVKKNKNENTQTETMNLML